MVDVSPQSIYRVLDASANRAGEGLRTIEEYARFVLDDPQATSALKSLRHDLADALRKFPRESLLAARHTEGDVGTQLATPAEFTRLDMADVIAAAATRTAQSLRVIEEYAKTLDASVAAQVEQIRYRCYSLAADVELNVAGHQRAETLRQSHLYVLIDAGPDQDVYVARLRELVQSDVDILQLRDRSVDDRTLLRRARLGTEIARERGKLFIVNDRADLAMAAGADGVHVGQDELPAADARHIVGPQRLIGVSTHSIDQARAAVADGADYIGCGPVFPGRTKSFDTYVGTRLLSEIAAEIKIPAFAIGGIEESNLSQVLETGIRRIAVTGAVRDAAEPARAAAALKKRLRRDCTHD